MMIWKRKVGQAVVIGSDTLVEVKKIYDPQGNPVHGYEARLGFITPKGTRVQKAEKYTQDLEENLQFPRFYRMINRATRKSQGYSLDLPQEVDRRSDGFDYELIEGFEDMRDDDDRVELHLFRAESDAIAFAQGLELGDTESKCGNVIGRHGNIWLVMVHWYYQSYTQGPNPAIRDHLGRSERLMEALRTA